MIVFFVCVRVSLSPFLRLAALRLESVKILYGCFLVLFNYFCLQLKWEIHQHPLWKPPPHFPLIFHQLLIRHPSKSFLATSSSPALFDSIPIITLGNQSIPPDTHQTLGKQRKSTMIECAHDGQRKKKGDIAHVTGENRCSTRRIDCDREQASASQRKF